MKTLTRHFFNNQQHHLCERSSLQSLFSRLWLWVHGHCTRVRRNLSSRPAYALVVRGLHAGLTARLLPILSQVNRRVLVGLGMMGVVAPVSSCMYLLFDRRDFVQNWYHVNYFHLFLVLAPSLFLLSSLIGVWFMFPYRDARAYGLAIPAGFTIGKLLWLIQCTSNEDFYAVVPASFILIGALLSVFLFIVSDWLVHNVFHRQHAIERRLGTLRNGMDLVDGEEFKRLFKLYYDERKSMARL